MSKFNGDYEILPVDSSYHPLDETFTYSTPRYDPKNFRENDYIRLWAIDDRHLMAAVFENNKMRKAKRIKGRLVDNYFQFHSTHLKFRFLINVYEQQSNRLSLSNEGDLYLDTNHGGVAFLLFLPLPLSGAALDYYDLKYRRKK